MTPLRLTEQFKGLLQMAFGLTEVVGAEAVLLLAEGPADWPRVAKLAEGKPLVVAADVEHYLQGAREAGLPSILLDMPDSPVYEQLTQALLEAVADDILAPGASVVALYSGFEAGQIDSVSLIDLGEHLDRLTGRALRHAEDGGRPEQRVRRTPGPGGDGACRGRGLRR